MTSVMTVTGPIDSGELGITLMHEHLLLDLVGSPRGFEAGFDDKELAIEEVEAFKRAGGRTIVELSTRGIGRDAVGLRFIAQHTGLNIIACTGFYKEPAYPREVYECTSTELAELMVQDIKVGIDGTDIRAGIIGELGTLRHHVSPAQERVFRAGACTHKQTGLPITTHTHWGGELALAQIAILLDEEVPPHRIIIGHLGDTRDVDYYERIANYGVYVQFDHIGKERYLPDTARAEMIKQLIDRSFCSQLLLSTDLTYKTELHRYGGIGYDYLLTRFTPMLQRCGVSDEQIETLLVHNPRRAFVGEAT